MSAGEIYGFWDLLFPIYLMFVIGVIIFAISIDRRSTMYSLSLMGVYIISSLFVGYLMFFVKPQIDG
jgi:CHASE2 domain-containing sensor protein